MRLGLNIGYLGPHGSWPSPEAAIEVVREAERLGYAMLWTAEAFSSDAVSMLGWLAARTDRIALGTAAMQIPGRSPALTAMTAATLDLLSGGRFHLGLGVSSRQVAQDWHGVAFDHPLARTREYVGLVRQALHRRPLAHDGRHYPITPGATLRLDMRPLRRAVPIYLAAVGPRNIDLAGEIADGWLAVFLAPEGAADQMAAVRSGLQRSGRDPAAFDVAVTAAVAVGDRIEDCADRVRLYTMRYLAAMGDYYSRHAARIGYAEAVRAVRRDYQAGDLRAAAAAVPMPLLENTSLLGPVPAIAERLRAYADVGVRTLSVLVPRGDADRAIPALRAVAEALDKSGVGE
ncbi:LLM class flavin-dependent oxidoreductase [Mangrovihabitans endophyticus]|uniref:LLM class F420-dependent oxidoreductase n=1 Tax=Mangrovihabitans endophyticus TaxID=1751298 RepID=A0A8J3BUL0_9ACTN|nr:LLM class flavin-dependent oxidoreductase [Mangrovihabitans endophyticus]GGK75989.1 LLM class F420-dependent oxidoreductase [Mangrovihabitans endophyticus]